MPVLLYHCTIFPMVELTAEETNFHKYWPRMHRRHYNYNDMCMHCMPIMISEYCFDAIGIYEVTFLANTVVSQSLVG